MAGDNHEFVCVRLIVDGLVGFPCTGRRVSAHGLLVVWLPGAVPPLTHLLHVALQVLHKGPCNQPRQVAVGKDDLHLFNGLLVGRGGVD